MRAALLFLSALLWAQAPAPDPKETVARVFSQIEDITRRQPGQDARKIRALDRKIGGFKTQVVPLGISAVPALGSIASDKSRPMKVRLWAVAFMGFIDDPSVFPFVKGILEDASDHEQLRAAAADEIGALGLPPRETREVLCRVLEDPGAPEIVLSRALFQLSTLGCNDPAPLEKWARRWGPKPSPKEAPKVLRAIAALGRSPSPEAARDLLRLLDYYRQGAAQKEAVLAALVLKQKDLDAFRPEAAQSVRAALLSESQNPPAAVLALKLLSFLEDRDAAPLLLKLLDHPDCAVVAAAAQTLADLDIQEAREPLKRIIDNLLEDPRFYSAPGREPQKMAVQIQAAADSLLRSK